jgi:hypothetical protein
MLVVSDVPAARAQVKDFLKIRLYFISTALSPEMAEYPVSNRIARGNDTWGYIKHP